MDVSGIKTVRLSSSLSGAPGRGPDIFPGSGMKDQAQCAAQLALNPNQNLLPNPSSQIIPVSVAERASCGTYQNWPHCFSEAAFNLCAAESAPTCTDEDEGASCAACVAAENSVTNWWNKPSWWFSLEDVTATSAQCGIGASVVEPPPVGNECTITAIDASGLGMTPEQSAAFYESLKSISEFPSTFTGDEAAFFAKTDWSSSELQGIKSAVFSMVSTRRQELLARMNEKAAKDQENAAAEGGHDARKAEIEKQKGLAIWNAAAGGVAGVAGIVNMIQAIDINKKAKTVNKNANEIFKETNKFTGGVNTSSPPPPVATSE